MAKQVIVCPSESMPTGAELHSFIVSTSLFFLFDNNKQNSNMEFSMKLDPYQAGWLYGGTSVELISLPTDDAIIAVHNFVKEKGFNTILFDSESSGKGFVVTPIADGKAERIVRFAETLLSEEDAYSGETV